MAGNLGSSGGRFESDPREFDDAASLAGRELGGVGAPLSGEDADGNRLADVASGESFGGEELHDEAEFEEEEARDLSEELNREFGNFEPEAAENGVSEREATSLPNARVERYVLAVAFLHDRLSAVLASDPAAGIKVAIILEGTKTNRRQLSQQACCWIEFPQGGGLSGSTKQERLGAGLGSNGDSIEETAGVECKWKGSTKGLPDRNGQERHYSDLAWIATVADFRD